MKQKPKQSQTVKILDYLKRGNSLTPLQALRMFGSFRLGARVQNLRDAGVNVKTEMVKVNGKYIAKYSL